MTNVADRRLAVLAVAVVVLSLAPGEAGSAAPRRRDASHTVLRVARDGDILDVAEAAVLSTAAAALTRSRASLQEQLQSLDVVRQLQRSGHAPVGPWRKALHATLLALPLSTSHLALTHSGERGIDRRLRAALRSIASDVGTDLTSGEVAAVSRAVRRLLPGDRVAVARTVAAFATLSEVAAATYGAIDPRDIEEVRDAYLRRDAVEVVGADVFPSMLRDLGVSLSDVWHARTAFLSTLPALEDLQRRSKRGGPCDAVVVAPVLAIDTTGGDCSYKQHVALSIDVGGKDRYRNNAGGTNLEDVGCGGWPAPAKGAAAAIDLGGDDTYGTDPEGRDCGFNGGGFFGVGMLVDAAGDDVYRAGAVSTNGGGGNAGLGLLVDAQGDDRYLARSFGSNGGSNAGIGFILDGAGRDRYVATDWGANGGGYGGSGTIIDLGGSDFYGAIRIGANGGAWLGSGHLIDLGNARDVYDARESGVNGGANLGTGFLFDGGGNDEYAVGSGGANGGAWGAGSGMLLDAGGDDRYAALHVAVNGGGGFNASGFLIDWSGSDRFVAGDIGTNGGASFLGATGFLLDVSGDDVYLGGTRGANGAGDVGLGALVDLGGRDRYRDRDGGTGRDKTVAPKGEVGVQLDPQ